MPKIPVTRVTLRTKQQNKKINKNQDRRPQAEKWAHVMAVPRLDPLAFICIYPVSVMMPKYAKSSLSNTTKDQDYIASQPTTWPQCMHYLGLSCNLPSRANDTTDRGSDLLSHFAGTNLAFHPSFQEIPSKTIQSQPRVAKIQPSPEKTHPLSRLLHSFLPQKKHLPRWCQLVQWQGAECGWRTWWNFQSQCCGSLGILPGVMNHTNNMRFASSGREYGLHFARQTSENVAGTIESTLCWDRNFQGVVQDKLAPLLEKK